MKWKKRAQGGGGKEVIASLQAKCFLPYLVRLNTEFPSLDEYVV